MKCSEFFENIVLPSREGASVAHSSKRWVLGRGASHDHCLGSNIHVA